jgi:hypothetical protein
MDIAPPERAVRLVFEHDGDTVRLVAELPVEGAAAHSDAGAVPGRGHYVELQARDGALLSRVAVPDAFPDTVEVFPETAGDPILRVPAQRTGTFTTVVGVPQAAARVAVVRVSEGAGTAGPAGGPLPGAAAPGAVERTELASFDLSDPQEPTS